MDKLPLCAKFKVFPKGRWFFFAVFVWKRRGDMRKTLIKAGVYKGGNCEGCCVANRLWNAKQGMTGLLGQIHFHQNAFGMGTITHECTHAALAWAREKQINPMSTGGLHGLASNEEEDFCWVLGNIARQVVLKTYRQWKFDGPTTKDCYR